MGAIAFPPIDPVAFRVGPVQVHWYGLAYLAAFAVAWVVLGRLNRSWDIGLTEDDRLEVLFGAIAAVLVGSRLGWILVYGGVDDYMRHPLRVFALWEGGMSFHGGLVAMLLVGPVLARRTGVTFLRLADVAVVAAPAGFLFGRLANFVNGELWGRVTDVPWGVVFPGAGLLPRHPSQLYEAVLEGVILLGAMLLLARRRRRDGVMLGWFLLLYGSFRIFAECFRQPDADIGFIAGWLTMGQLLSVPMLAGGVWLLRRKRRHTGGPSGDAAGAPSGPGD